ncbi:acyl-CoA thioesterase [Aliikangiella sp. IMCC44653]
MSALEEFKAIYCVTHQQELIWGDMDAFQHINNTVYFRYFENVRMAYFNATQVNQVMAKDKIGPILGATDCRFLAPLTYPDKITIGTQLTALRSKRFTMEYAIFSEKQEKVVAQGSGEIIYFDYTQQCSHKVPSKVVASILALQPELKQE